MLTIKAIYNNDSDFIVNIVDLFKDVAYIEHYNISTSKQKSKIRKMQENFGSVNLPLIIIEDENLKEVNAIWSENNPDWEKELNRKLKMNYK